MRKRVNFYKDLAADYSKPDPMAPALAKKLLEDAAEFIAKKEASLPAIGADYTLQQIEAENKAWWPTHCEALRQGRGDLLIGEYRDDLVYHCQDGPYYGSTSRSRASSTGGRSSLSPAFAWPGRSRCSPASSSGSSGPVST